MCLTSIKVQRLTYDASTLLCSVESKSTRHVRNQKRRCIQNLAGVLMLMIHRDEIQEHAAGFIAVLPDDSCVLPENIPLRLSALDTFVRVPRLHKPEIFAIADMVIQAVGASWFTL